MKTQNGNARQAVRGRDAVGRVDDDRDRPALALPAMPRAGSSARIGSILVATDDRRRHRRARRPAFAHAWIDRHLGLAVRAPVGEEQRRPSAGRRPDRTGLPSKSAPSTSGAAMPDGRVAGRALERRGSGVPVMTGAFAPRLRRIRRRRRSAAAAAASSCRRRADRRSSRAGRWQRPPPRRRRAAISAGQQPPRGGRIAARCRRGGLLRAAGLRGGPGDRQGSECHRGLHVRPRPGHGRGAGRRSAGRRSGPGSAG